ncbi:MAG: DUF421 domain-containing protein [Proteobacteria bacterium]|nr:DUF421 domain-containing protein [Burkholderiales bacterium]
MDPLEIVVRGTAIYWFLFMLFRFVLRRDVGSMAIADVLLLVLIADASGNAMSGSYETIVDGMLLVATIAGWSYLLDWLGYHFVAIRRFLEPAPLRLVQEGIYLRKNMRAEMLTIDELESELRLQGIDDVRLVREAFMESNGELSVLKYDTGPEDGARNRPDPKRMV